MYLSTANTDDPAPITHFNGGPLVGNNFSFSASKTHASLKHIAHIYDVTKITEKQKHAMSKALYDQGIINAIEHAILCLPSLDMKQSLAQWEHSKEVLNLIDIYQKKVLVSQNYTNLSAEKAIDLKFLFIMQDLYRQQVH